MKFLLVTSLRKVLVKVWVCQETSPAGSLLPPVDLASIASAIRQTGHEVRILDLRLLKKPLERYTHELNVFNPDSVILNLSTTGANYDYDLIAATPDSIKKICFGTHAVSLPEECFNKGVDYVLSGDPEHAILSLIKNKMDGSASEGVLTADNLNKNPAYWEDLDTMPFPAIDLLDMRQYHAPYIRRGNLFTLLLGSRGCSYKCIYCLYPVFFGNRFRLRSVKNITDEIEQDLAKYGIKEFYFLDATFNTDKLRVEDFCNELLGRRLQVNWSCNMRVSPVTSDMLSLMKKAGCRSIFYGVEDQDYLIKTNKGISRRQTIEAFRLTKEAGITTIAFIMLFPEREINDDKYAKNTLNTLKILEADAFQCNIAIPFPGTLMFNNSEAKYNIDWNLYDPHGRELPYKCGKDLVRVRRDIYIGFLFSHPLRTIKIILKMDFRSFWSMLFAFGKKFF